jgi:hypothetical protein
MGGKGKRKGGEGRRRRLKTKIANINDKVNFIPDLSKRSSFNS